MLVQNAFPIKGFDFLHFCLQLLSFDGEFSEISRMYLRLHIQCLVFFIQFPPNTNFRDSLIKIPNITCQEDLSTKSHVVPCGQTDMMMTITIFHGLQMRQKLQKKCVVDMAELEQVKVSRQYMT